MEDRGGVTPVPVSSGYLGGPAGVCFVAPGWWGPLSGGRVVTKIMLRRGRSESQGGFGPPGGAVPVGMLRGTGW